MSYNFSNLVESGYNYYDLSSFFTYTNPTTNKSTRTVDDRYSPQALVRGFTDSRVALSIFESIQKQLTPDEFSFYGKSKAVNKALNTLLNSAVDFKDILLKICVSFYGVGGDFLIYQRKDGSIQAKTFFENGQFAISYIRDPRINKIVEYQILNLENQNDIIERVSPKDALHLTYANPFGTPVGISPAMILAPLWNLKRMIDTSQETIYSQGMQASKLISVKSDSASSIFSQLTNSKVREDLMADIRLLKEQLTSVTGLGNRNKTLLTYFPGLQVDDLQMNNSEMRTLEVIDKYIDKQTYITYSQDPTLFDTGLAKYKNAEIMRDIRNKAIEYKSKVVTKELVQGWLLPRIYPKYDAIKYPFEYVKAITEESLAQEQQTNSKDSKTLEIFIKAKTAGLNVDISEEKKEEFLERYGLVINSNHILDTKLKNENLELEKQTNVNEYMTEEGILIESRGDETTGDIGRSEMQGTEEIVVLNSVESKKNTSIKRAKQVFINAIEKQLEKING